SRRGQLVSSSQSGSAGHGGSSSGSGSSSTESSGVPYRVVPGAAMATGGHGDCVPAVAAAMSALSTGSDERVTLIVDNTRFVVDPALFALQPDTMLGR
ncbi:hypothetical protein MTO96_047255, partial [Rhipicephalus appendiculatus]